MSIEAVSGVQGAWGSAMTSVVPAADFTSPDRVAGAGSGDVFGAGLTSAIDELQALQSTSDELAVRAVTGDLDDVHDYTIAATQAQVALELTAALRNKAVDAFNEIMRMQA